jgi:hypothetical protein
VGGVVSRASQPQELISTLLDILGERPLKCDVFP